MIYKYLRVIAIIFLIGVILSSGVSAGEELNSVLGIPWGASPEQARQIMIANGHSFFRENSDRETGTPMQVFKGTYEGMPSFDFFLRFMNGQFWHLEAGTSSNEDSRLNYVFDKLYQLMIQKYGPVSRDESKQNTTKYIWSLNGESKRITLAKMGTFFFGEEKFSGVVYVTYKNIQLYEALKKQKL